MAATAEIPGQYRPSDQYLGVAAGSPVPRERSQDSPTTSARWRADAADDAGFLAGAGAWQGQLALVGTSVNWLVYRE